MRRAARRATVRWPAAALGKSQLPPSWLTEPPLPRKDPLPGLEWLLLGPLSRWRGREGGREGVKEEGGGYTDLENIVNSLPPPPILPITLHPITLPYPLSLPPHPPQRTDRLSAACVRGYEISSSCSEALEAARAVKHNEEQDRGIWTLLSVINGPPDKEGEQGKEGGRGERQAENDRGGKTAGGGG
ncbi:unnamed protein product [Pleuronectes platessa]|uniref:Uncharacterized protein n=1 Tax=Pleuronectes platessa TaxID=8262 RepID=A0A9N7TUA0_PLEPL|nr:unnamed protein product [Pleuronectes platessa]